jgi:hypothetical protein
MKQKLLAKIGLAMVMALLISGCGAPAEPPEPHDYSHTTELKQIEVYESERIRDAERLVLVTLEQLGCGDLTLSGGEEDVSTEPVVFQLPEDATQGPDIWYIFYLHFLIEFEEDCGGGYGSVGAKGAGASVFFDTIRVNDSPFIRIGSQSSDSIRIEVSYYNYMGQRHVKPGEGELSFELSQNQGMRVKSVTIYKDSGIETTTVSPSEYAEGLKLSEEEQAMAREIAFGDPRVQELAEGKEYAVSITMGDGVVRGVDEPPEDVEVKLVFTQNYMIEDIEATALDIFVNLNEGVITYLFPLDELGMPTLTESAREKAVAIALSDAGVLAELEGKGYTIERVGPTMGGPAGRLGAQVLFNFDEPYPLEPEVPEAMERIVTGVRAIVNLQEEKVVDILEESEPVDF